MDSIPLYRLNPSGEPEHLGALAPLADGFRLEATADLPRWMLGVEGNGEFPDLPFIAEDLQPQGFLGTIAVGGDPERLSSTQVLDYLIREGVDLPGDLIIGEAALQQAMQSEVEPTDPGEFDALADQVKASGGVPGGALVGGAKPKFCAYTDQAVIVKFAPAGDQRMCDLLVCEHLALDTLAAAGIPAAQTQIRQSERYMHLEVVRFDRAGARGRRPVVSLKALDAEYAGVGHGWPAIMGALRNEGLVAQTEVDRAELLNLYGMMIENSDRHAGNLALVPDAAEGLAVAPAYDMLPMRYAMFAGDLTQPPALQIPAGEGTPVWEQAVELAHAFWSSVQDDERVSQPFRTLAQVRVGELEQVMDLEAPGPA